MPHTAQQLNKCLSSRHNNKKKLKFTSLLLEWLPSRTQTVINDDEDMRKKESSYIAGGNVN
jgi:hypothetical protein